jgi:hypothetical protein
MMLGNDVPRKSLLWTALCRAVDDESKLADEDTESGPCRELLRSLAPAGSCTSSSR